MSADSAQLAAEFDLPDALRIHAGADGETRLTIDTSEVHAVQTLHGSTVLHWQPAGQDQPVFFVSERAEFAEGVWVHGGVPICFPWFGGHPTDPDAPGHGIVRAAAWDLIATGRCDGGVTIDTAIQLDHLRAEHRVCFGRQITMRLTVTNTSEAEQRFEETMHTYFAVGDLRRVQVTGLEESPYFDANHGKRLPQPAAGRPVTFAGETTQIYHHGGAVCALIDPVWERRVAIETRGARSTVVWTPWAERAAEFARQGELLANEWPNLCCLESGNIEADAVILAPGETHELEVRYRVEAI